MFVFTSIGNWTYGALPEWLLSRGNPIRTSDGSGIARIEAPKDGIILTADELTELLKTHAIMMYRSGDSLTLALDSHRWKFRQH